MSSQEMYWSRGPWGQMAVLQLTYELRPKWKKKKNNNKTQNAVSRSDPLQGSDKKPILAIFPVLGKLTHMETTHFKKGLPLHKKQVIFFTQPQFEAKKLYTWKADHNHAFLFVIFNMWLWDARQWKDLDC